MRTRCLWRQVMAGVVLWGWVALFGPGVACADDTDDLIGKISRQARSRVEAAKKLLAAAESLDDVPKTQIRLWTKACEYGMTSPSGYATVLAALDKLERVAPEKLATWRDKRLAVYREQYYRSDKADRAANGSVFVEALLARGGESEKANDWAGAAKHYRLAYGVARTINLSSSGDILDRARTAENLLGVHTRIAGLKGIIAKDPAASAARKKLVMMYLVDLDMPREAAKHLGKGLPPALSKNVSMAAREAAALKDEDLLTLGKWYKTLVPQATTSDAKANMLTRARDNLGMYLEVHTKQDIARLGAAEVMKAVKAELSALSGSGKPKTAGVSPTPTRYRPRWINLLAEVNPERHGVNGQWVRRGSAIAGMGTRHTAVTVPLTASGSYDLQTTFTLVNGHVVNVIVPVGKGQTAILLGTVRGTVIMLERVGSKDNNPTRLALSAGSRWFPVGARTALNVSVRVKDDMAQITASLNGRKVIDWTGKHAPRTVGPFWSVPARTFGFATHGGTLAVHSARVRLLDPADGNVKWVSKDATFKLSSAPKRYSPRKGFLSGTGRLAGGWGIHTDLEEKPHMIITLRQPCQIKRVFIVNRIGEQDFPAAGLTVWTSMDAQTWQQLWRAPGRGTQKMWLLDLQPTVGARYVKIGLDGMAASYLHLADVRIYAAAAGRQ